MSLQHIHLEGNLFTSDHLARVQAGDKELGGLSAQDYNVKRRLDEEISEAYNGLERAWKRFLLKHEMESTPARAVTDEWVEAVWRALGGGPLFEKPVEPIEGKAYPIRFQFEGVPIHVVPFNQHLEKGPNDTARGNAHSTLQEYLNRREEALWGILTNGYTFRLLRDNANNTRPAYVEFDLKGMMDSGSFVEFGIFWRMCHYTRLLDGHDSWLEKWMHESASRGTPARDLLRGAVENALNALGRGFLRHPRNKALRRRLQNGELTPNDYYRQLLRLVYRLIFLFVTEDRGLLLDPRASSQAKELYGKYYSTRRLRSLAQTVRGTRHHDLYEGVKVVMDGLKDSKGRPALALPPLNSDLWSRTFIPDLDPPAASENAETGHIENRDLLSAIHHLSRIRLAGGEYRTVDYRNLGSDELGSIYESLLELEATVDAESRQFKLAVAGGGERKTTGSHYTPQNLIDEVLDHALEPLLDDAETAHAGDPEKAIRAILDLTVCDPTCGSGHFLIAAAHRMAKRVARLRTGDPEPAPGDLRRALRDVIGRCIYGVDINPMSVELCKVSLWLEAMEPGKPLAYLEHHIKCGNALLGAWPEYLERGVPPEAYSARPNRDDETTCRSLVKRNQEFPMSARTLENFRLDRKKVDAILIAALERVERMPTTTVQEVDAKADEYQKTFVDTDEYWRYKYAMDAWCAAFSYPKMGDPGAVHLTNVELVDFLHAGGVVPRDTIDMIEIETSKVENRFFHWTLEFPTVFRRGGFDAVIGNPPYMGATRMGEELGTHYNNYMQALYPGYRRKADLAGAFLLRFRQIAQQMGRIGLITTNSIAKGETRLSSLARIVASGGHILMARPDVEWPGRASVIVALLVIGPDVHPRILKGEAVQYISSRLDQSPEYEPQRLTARQGVCFEGHKPAASGFIVPREVAAAWIRKDSREAEVVRPYLTAEDLLQTPGQQPSRFAICYNDWPKARAEQYPLSFAHVANVVRPQRENVSTKAWRDKWWLFGHFSAGLEKSGAKNVIVRPRVSETPLFIRLPNGIIFSDRLTVFADGDWETVGLLNSGIHEVWYRRTGTYLKQDISYMPRACFETFPLPRSDPDVARLAEAFHSAVLTECGAGGIPLTPLWNRVNDPSCTDDEIVRIRSERDRLTWAVASAFDIEVDFRFGHYKDHAERWRYTMHPEAAAQVYLKLVELNAQQAAGAVNVAIAARKRANGQAKLTGPQQTRLED